jgi:hypothetical protein
MAGRFRSPGKLYQFPVIVTDHLALRRRADFSEALAFRGISRAAPWA